MTTKKIAPGEPVATSKPSKSAALAALGAWMIEQLRDEASPWCAWGSQEAEEIAEKAVAFGCPGIERVPYDPAKHGEEVEAEPGDLIWFFPKVPS